MYVGFFVVLGLGMGRSGEGEGEGEGSIGEDGMMKGDLDSTC